MICDGQNSSSNEPINLIDNIVYKTACNPSLLPTVYEDLVRKLSIDTISSLTKIIPSSKAVLAKIIAKLFPFPNDSIEEIKRYIAMILELNSSSYLPLVMEKLIGWEMEALINDEAIDEILCYIIDILEPQMNIVFYDKIILESIFYGKIINSSLGLNLIPWFCYFWSIKSDEYMDLFLGTLVDRLFNQGTMATNIDATILIGYIAGFIGTSKDLIPVKLTELVIQILKYYCLNITKKDVVDQTNLAINHILKNEKEESVTSITFPSSPSPSLPFNRDTLSGRKIKEKLIKIFN